MGTTGERKAARDRVAAYHEACLGELVERVGIMLDRYRASQVDVYGLDESIHQYHKAAKELWKFCWGLGSGDNIEMVAHLIDQQTTRGDGTDWWERGVPRRP